jgi:hypothetical protein
MTSDSWAPLPPSWLMMNTLFDLLVSLD